MAGSSKVRIVFHSVVYGMKRNAREACSAALPLAPLPDALLPIPGPRRIGANQFAFSCCTIAIGMMCDRAGRASATTQCCLTGSTGSRYRVSSGSPAGVYGLAFVRLSDPVLLTYREIAAVIMEAAYASSITVPVPSAGLPAAAMKRSARSTGRVDVARCDCSANSLCRSSVSGDGRADRGAGRGGSIVEQ